jgi:hypothetical protein
VKTKEADTMGKTIISRDMLPEIVEQYNTEGKKAVYDTLRSRFGMKRPDQILNRIKRSGQYVYDNASDRFISTSECAGDKIFMGLDELCSRRDTSESAVESMSPTKMLRTMEALVNELINDRLLTLSRYITLDTSTRTIIIDRTSLSADGYRVVTH